MEVIPVINCSDLECVGKRINIIRELESEWVEFDISDGKFASGVTWNNPGELVSNFRLHISRPGIAVHLMVEEPEDYVSEWLKIGAKRIIIHVESDFNFEKIHAMCDEYGTELMLALKPGTETREAEPFLEKGINAVQFLAVDPGPSGQKLQDKTLEKVRSLRREHPNVKIEVDGGINPETAKLAKEAGADIVVSGSYIFDNDNPIEAYKKLRAVVNNPV